MTFSSALVDIPGDVLFVVFVLRREFGQSICEVVVLVRCRRRVPGGCAV